MSYHFERYETVAVGVRRIVGELTWTATNELRAGHPNFHAWVHNTRTTYKKIRSLLRLVRADLDKPVYQHEQSRIRDAGSQLSRLRDAEVLVQICDLLIERYPHCADRDTLVESRNALLNRYQRIVQIESNLQQLLLATANELADLTVRAADWPLAQSEYTTPIRSFERGYRRGRRAFGKAYLAPSGEGFHEWRKRIKDHWYHCRLFDPVWPPSIIGRISDLKGLADLLGEDHDLAVLQMVLADETDEIGIDGNLLSDLAWQRQQELRDQAAALSQGIYAIEPEELTRQLSDSLARWV